MERIIARVLVVFAVGFALIALVVAGYDGGCGSLFSATSCDHHPTGQVIATIILVGLALTCGVAAYEAYVSGPRPPEEPPTIYPGGAQV
ncbi:hypothetical protein [Nocardioides marmorisolisilvae]|uniref:Uncharacterized protein n=1 Tax=Nocardioides marmorisolisilvae TaxID=1542737 RepID=A0A3N0DRV6_9ACTN|nr:hypothetical protein [Nocardioides marmorisolisilvae]RNL78367.1 hypothetical protein EFL95_04485 [Nocardioides marmorisolisilvae]